MERTRVREVIFLASILIPKLQSVEPDWISDFESTHQHGGGYDFHRTGYDCTIRFILRC